MTYSQEIEAAGQIIGSQNGTWDSISPEAVARMRLLKCIKFEIQLALNLWLLLCAEPCDYEGRFLYL